jgi:2-keto-myo-inositol isomerase
MTGFAVAPLSLIEAESSSTEQESFHKAVGVVGITWRSRVAGVVIVRGMAAPLGVVAKIYSRLYARAKKGRCAMIEKRRFALNRITCPSLSLEDFFHFAAELGLSKVELRNDLPGAKVTDGVQASRAAAIAQASGVHIITINALQKFNLKEARQKTASELERLLDQAAELHCPAIVLCPNNDSADKRDAKTKVAETVDALKAFGPSFMERGILGYVEPLGFHESSLASIIVAVETIRSSGFSCYRTVYDTFHHYVGPDTENDIGPHYQVSNTGIIHISAVEADVAKENYRDEHRVLPGPKDKTFCKEQIGHHDRLGYTGDISFEPFAATVQHMDHDRLASALKESIRYLQG